MVSTRLLPAWLLVAVLVVGQAVANEWFTSREQHCIEKCTIRNKKGVRAYSCYTVDGINKEFIPGNRTNNISGRPGFNGPIPALDNDARPWDYCTPSKAAGLESDKTGTTPAPQPIDNGQGGFNAGEKGQGGGAHGGGFNPGNVVFTSFENVACSGACRRDDANTFKCDYGGGQEKFYCSPDYPLDDKRKQITSHNKLYCIGPCEQNFNTNDHRCKTMAGEDHCSKSSGFSTKEVKCLGPCAVHPEAGHNYLSCKVDQTQYEQCGNWDMDGINTKALEYTQEGQICAGPCKNNNGEMLCSYVEWRETGTEDAHKSTLYMMEGDCGPDAGMNWTLIGIILGSVVGAVVIIAVVGILISRRSSYNRTATNEM